VSESAAVLAAELERFRVAIATRDETGLMALLADGQAARARIGAKT
jgi:hypothetical protein